MPRIRLLRHIARLVVDYLEYAARLVMRLVVDYCAYAVRPVASARRVVHHRLLHLRRASGCFGTSRGLSHDSSSTTSPMPRVRVPRLFTRLITPFVAPLVID
jgi:hypothetical protein